MIDIMSVFFCNVLEFDHFNLMLFGRYGHVVFKTVFVCVWSF